MAQFVCQCNPEDFRARRTRLRRAVLYAVPEDVCDPAWCGFMDPRGYERLPQLIGFGTIVRRHGGRNDSNVKVGTGIFRLRPVCPLFLQVNRPRDTNARYAKNVCGAAFGFSKIQPANMGVIVNSNSDDRWILRPMRFRPQAPGMAEGSGDEHSRHGDSHPTLDQLPKCLFHVALPPRSDVQHCSFAPRPISRRAVPLPPGEAGEIHMPMEMEC